MDGIQSKYFHAPQEHSTAAHRSASTCVTHTLYEVASCPSTRIDASISPSTTLTTYPTFPPYMTFTPVYVE